MAPSNSHCWLARADLSFPRHALEHVVLSVLSKMLPHAGQVLLRGLVRESAAHFLEQNLAPLLGDEANEFPQVSHVPIWACWKCNSHRWNRNLIRRIQTSRKNGFS